MSRRDTNVANRDVRPTKQRATITALSCRVYRVPTDQPESDGTLTWRSTTVVVVEVCSGSHVGTGWTYGSAASQSVVCQELADEIVGHDALDIVGLHEAMVRSCRDFGRPGVVASAISAVDIALWDLKAHCLGVSLSKLLGSCRDDVPLYGSGGFTSYDDLTTGRQLEHWVDELGMSRVKIKVAESWGGNVARDVERTAFARQVIGDGVDLYVDANGGYSRKQAVRVGQRFEDLGVVWFEEPVSSDDLAGLREVRNHLALDVTAGEYGYDESYFVRMIAAEAVDCVQIDVTRCGGYTSWLRAAAIAGANGLEVSGHSAPSLHAPVALATANLRHVEYFHDHARVEELLFDGVPTPKSGVLVVDPTVPGHGMSLKAEDAAIYRLA